jgi:hypothetical protein
MEPRGRERHGRPGRETERVGASESNGLQHIRDKLARVEWREVV